MTEGVSVVAQPRDVIEVRHQPQEEGFVNEHHLVAPARRYREICALISYIIMISF